MRTFQSSCFSDVGPESSYAYTGVSRLVCHNVDFCHHHFRQQMPIAVLSAIRPSLFRASNQISISIRRCVRPDCMQSTRCPWCGIPQASCPTRVPTGETSSALVPASSVSVTQPVVQYVWPDNVRSAYVRTYVRTYDIPVFQYHDGTTVGVIRISIFLKT
jgi:hypothetical protein